MLNSSCSAYSGNQGALCWEVGFSSSDSVYGWEEIRKPKEENMPEDVIQGEGFTIKDRRAFDSEGKAREPSEKAEQTPKKAKDTAETAQEEPRKETREKAPPLPEVNFSSFLLSLSSSVLLHLGEIPEPQSGEKRKDMALAKQSIDILTLLKEKTEGNLTEEEKNLLENLLYDLRMRFVKASE
jgi:hypothetical protein